MLFGTYFAINLAIAVLFAQFSEVSGEGTEKLYVLPEPGPVAARHGLRCAAHGR